MKTMAQRLSFRRLDAMSGKAFIAMVTLLVMTAGITVAAANRFAVVGVENGTHVTIRLQHKWGDGNWRTDVLRPGGRKWFWHEYSRANENHSPAFRVRFDSDLNPGEVFHINYALKKNAAPAHEWENANKYIFRYDGNRNYIDLFDAR
jgi:hypothetical protein